MLCLLENEEIIEIVDNTADREVTNDLKNYLDDKDQRTCRRNWDGKSKKTTSVERNAKSICTSYF